MFVVPAVTVASACGLPATQAVEAAHLVGDFVQCIPASATAPQQQAAARAAGRLQELLGPLASAADEGPPGSILRALRPAGDAAADALANTIGLLSQTYDATAGLIGNALVALARSPRGQAGRAPLERFVREVARHDSPIQNTRRFAAEPLRVGDAQLAAGDAILLVLAAANRDPAANLDPHAFRPERTTPRLFSFGSAAHRCPGESIAVAIAAGVLDALLGAGLDPAPLAAPAGYRSSPNARIPLL